MDSYYNRGGEASTSYLTNNDYVQMKAIFFVKPSVRTAIQECLNKCHFPEKSLKIAEIGYCSGPPTFDIMDQIVDVVHGNGRNMISMLEVYFIYGPRDDFNKLIQLQGVYKEKLKREKRANFGDFLPYNSGADHFGTLRPPQSLHFAPPALDGRDPTRLNQRQIYISTKSSLYVNQAYRKQYRDDFLRFLRSRSQELVNKGHMVLSFVGTTNKNNRDHYCWTFMTMALMEMVQESKISVERVNKFNVSYYLPDKGEVEELVKEVPTLRVYDFKVVRLQWYALIPRQHEDELYLGTSEPKKGETLAKANRAVTEWLFADQLQLSPDLIDIFYKKYAKILDARYFSTKEYYEMERFIISLVKY